MKTLVSFLIIFILFFSAFGQKELIATFPYSSNPGIVHSERRNDSVAIYTGNQYDSYFFNIDLTNSTLSVQSDALVNQRNLQAAGSSLFFTTFAYLPNGYDGHHYINFQDFEGNRFVSVAINDDYTQGNVINYEPHFSTLLNNEYYIEGYHNSEYCIWRSNGTAGGTSVVAHHPAPIQSMDVVNDRLIYSTRSATQFTIYTLLPGGTPVIIYQVPVVNVWLPDISPISTRQDRAFFRVSEASNQYSVWVTDPSNSFISLFRDSCDAYNVVLVDSTFFISLLDEATGKYNRCKGNLSDPYTTTPVLAVYDNGFEPEYHSENELGEGYFQSYTNEKGRELAYQAATDTFHIIKDFVPGAGSGLVSFLSADSDSVALTIQTIGLKSFFCKIDRDSIQPLFYVDDAFAIKGGFLFNSYVYWYENDTSNYLKLFRRSVTDMDSIDTDQQESLTWYKELGTIGANSGGNLYYSIIYNEGMFIDEEDAVLAAFTNSQIDALNFVVEDGHGGVEKLKGRDVVSKRDKYGNLEWVTSLGSEHDYYDHGLMTKTTHDDLLLVNDFTYKAFFESDSMTTTSLGNYLVKLSNGDGSILWKKNLFPLSNSGQNAICDGLASDEKGNVYMSFLYFGFYAMLEDYEITSEVSPANALAKFDSLGNILWVENILTPWTDNYGYTTVLKWNTDKQTLLAVQTQARYNMTSSCDYTDFQTFVQTIDTSGIIVDTFNYVADDLSGIITGEILPDNNYFLSGYYRGKLNIGDFSTISEPGNNCYKSEGYQLEYSPQTSSPVSLIRSYEKGFYPVSSVLKDSFIYVLGSDNSYQLKIARFTDKGMYSGYLPLNQIQSVGEFDSRHNYIDVKNGYIVISSQSFTKDSVLGVYPYTPNIDPISCVLKIGNKGWIMDDYFDHQSVPTNTFLNWSSDLDVIVYPNPFGDKISLDFKILDHGYDSYELYDLNGRLIKSGSFNHTELQQSIAINLHSNALFMLHLIGSEKEDVFKLAHWDE